MVSQETAERRAEICTGCIYNVFPAQAKFDEYADMLAEAATFGRKTELDAKLGNCDICTCTLRAKVHFSKLHFTRAEAKKFPPWCWQRREAQIKPDDKKSNTSSGK